MRIKFTVTYLAVLFLLLLSLGCGGRLAVDDTPADSGMPPDASQLDDAETPDGGASDGTPPSQPDAGVDPMSFCTGDDRVFHLDTIGDQARWAPGSVTLTGKDSHWEPVTVSPLLTVIIERGSEMIWLTVSPFDDRAPAPGTYPIEPDGGVPFVELGVNGAESDPARGSLTIGHVTLSKNDAGTLHPVSLALWFDGYVDWRADSLRAYVRGCLRYDQHP